jgi:hypothetical protein
MFVAIICITWTLSAPANPSTAQAAVLSTPVVNDHVRYDVHGSSNCKDCSGIAHTVTAQVQIDREDEAILRLLHTACYVLHI